MTQRHGMIESRTKPISSLMFWNIQILPSLAKWKPGIFLYSWSEDFFRRILWWILNLLWSLLDFYCIRVSPLVYSQAPLILNQAQRAVLCKPWLKLAKVRYTWINWIMRPEGPIYLGLILCIHKHLWFSTQLETQLINWYLFKPKGLPCESPDCSLRKSGYTWIN